MPSQVVPLPLLDLALVEDSLQVLQEALESLGIATRCEPKLLSMWGMLPPRSLKSKKHASWSASV